jgi:acetylornithine deacetylase/succinyl-diaminopimelate desuccinylase-like protein
MKMFHFVCRGLLVLAVATLTLTISPAEAEAQSGTGPSAGNNALARELLRELVEIDTTPAQGCTKAAQALATRLRDAGFPESDVLLLGPRPDRQNLVVRMRGRGKAKPILVIAHLDTVDAPREGWHSDPFRLTERDGFFYGRGVNDVKNEAADVIANLIRLRTEGFAPDRDIVVALTADEETGNANGVAWLLREHRDLLEVDYCLNLDGGGGMIEKGQRVRLLLETCQKFNVTFRLETKGPAGHPSMPEKENPICRLSAGVARLGQYQFPFRFNETTRAYFERLAQHETGQVAADMRAVAQDPPDLDAAKRLADASTFSNAILHTALAVLRMEGGQAGSGLPETARATVICRVFPGDTPEFVRSSIETVLADPKITLTVIHQARPSPVAPLRPEILEAVERAAKGTWPDTPVLPVLAPWSSDSATLLRAGIPSYGVSAMFCDEQANTHGSDERLPIASFDQGVNYFYEVLKTLASIPVTNDFPRLIGDYLGQSPPGATPQVFARGIVSTDDKEHGVPVFSPDGNEVFWQEARPPGPNNSEWLGWGMTVRRENGQWSAPRLSPYLSLPVFSADGGRLYFGAPRPGATREDGQQDIWVAERQGNGWSTPKCLDLIARSPELQLATWPTIARNGNLYFVSSVPEQRNKLGIARAEFINGEYAKPKLLPGNINLAPYRNWAPFIAPDESYLVFSSTRPGSLDDEGDLYISRPLGDGKWTDPTPLGSPINTPMQERFSGLSPDGKYFFFTRWSPEHDEDVYWVDAASVPELHSATTGPGRARLSWSLSRSSTAKAGRSAR